MKLEREKEIKSPLMITGIIMSFLSGNLEAIGRVEIPLLIHQSAPGASVKLTPIDNHRSFIQLRIISIPCMSHA